MLWVCSQKQVCKQVNDYLERWGNAVSPLMWNLLAPLTILIRLPHSAWQITAFKRQSRETYLRNQTTGLKRSKRQLCEKLLFFSSVTLYHGFDFGKGIIVKRIGSAFRFAARKKKPAADCANRALQLSQVKTKTRLKHSHILKPLKSQTVIFVSYTDTTVRCFRYLP